MKRIPVLSAPIDNTPVHVTLATDANFLPFCAATILSIISASKKTDILHFHVLCDRMPSFDDISKFDSIVSRTSSTIEFVPVSPGEHAKLKTNPGISEATYYRLRIASALPPEISRTVYIDSDIVALGRIKDLASIDMEGNLLVGVEDGSSALHAARAGQTPESKHVNGGVLVLDLAGLREANFEQLVEEYVSPRRYTIIMGDQQILNGALEGRIGYVGAAWNLHGSMHVDSWRQLNCGVGNSYTPQELAEAAQKPMLIHFTSDRKPWQQGGEHPHGSKFLRYLRASPYGSAFRTPVSSDRRPRIDPPNVRQVHDGIHNAYLMGELYRRNVDQPTTVNDLLQRYGEYAVVASNSHAEDVNGGNAQNHKLLFKTNKFTTPQLDADWESCAYVVLVKWFRSDATQLQLLSHALSSHKRVLFVETTFFGGFASWAEKQLPPEARRPLGFIVDDLAFYFDATRPSRLELTLNDKDFSLSKEEIYRARALIKRIVEHRLTKYNYLPDHRGALVDRSGFERAVLVVDQGEADSSIELGLANAHTFSKMLDAAIAENPDAIVLVKTHPDTVAKGRPSHFVQGHAHPRVKFISTQVNPHTLLDNVDSVYSVSSQLGFEALLRGKRVVLFGAPFYAGWGLTDDRIQIPRRSQRRTIEDVFHTACITHSLYLDTQTGETCTMERALDQIEALRSRQWLPVRLPPGRKTLNDEIRKSLVYRLYAAVSRPLQGETANKQLATDPDSYFRRKTKSPLSGIRSRIGAHLTKRAARNVRSRVHGR